MVLKPWLIFLHLWRYRQLILQFTKRHILERYKGSFLGMAWSFIQPLIMLAIYTFVFSVIFQAKWDVGTEQGRGVFAMTLFTGIITFNLFAESANEAPTIILNHSNLVKKVVFPLEVLPVVIILSALVNSLFSFSILMLGLLSFGQPLPWTVSLLPMVWMPLIFFSLGFVYFLSSLGVFIRDIGATVGLLTTVLFFMSPIFYPLSAVPQEFHFISEFNPIAVFVEQSRGVVLWGQLPEWPGYFSNLLLSLLIFISGFAWFSKSKSAFADVL